MTGPEHYTRAQNLIDTVTNAEDDLIVSLSGGSEPGMFTTHTLAAAQVHATLALAAAVAVAAIASCDQAAGVKP